MKKSLFALALVVILAGVAILLAFPRAYSFFNQEVVFIAVVGPMSGADKENGENMLQGINLYLDKLKETGELGNKRIALLIEDDHNDAQRAEEIALKIVRENKALLVLGHVLSASSLAAGVIYRKYEIPALTASATVDRLTLDSKGWYFRVIPNNGSQAKFLAHYLKNTLKKEAVSIIAMKNEYSASLARIMKTTTVDLGIPVLKEWRIDPDAPNQEADLRQIVAELTALPESCAIFLATAGGKENIELITALRDSGKAYTIIGDDSFDETFPGLFEAYPREQAQPGYYSDGIYAVSPFMLETGNRDAYDFEQQFVKKYRTKLSSWNQPCHYDAMHVVVEAIKRAKLQGPGHIRSDRRNLRKALADFYSPETAVNGVTGPIYFDANGDVTRPYAVGFFKKRKFLPAFTQYQLTAPENIPENLIEAALTGDIIQLNDQIVNKIPMCWGGAVVHEVNRIDLVKGRYTVDFSLWYRFQGEINDTVRIKFTNALTPMQLVQPPIVEHENNDITIRLYRFRGDFAVETDLHAYPFESHILPIKFRYSDAAHNPMIYVPDRLGLPDAVKQQLQGTLTSRTQADWKIVEIVPYADMERNVSTLGFPRFFGSTHTLTAPRFNVDIRIARNDFRLLAQSLAPFLFLSLILGITFALPANWLFLRIALAAASLAANVGWHVTRTATFPVAYLTTLDYAGLSLDLAAILAALLALSAYAFYQRRLALVHSIDLFQPFSEKMKAALSRKMRRRRFRRPGQTIIRQGEPGESLFAIFTGEVNVQVTLTNGRTIVVNQMQPGAFFGEMALLTGEARTATVISSTPVFLGELTKADLTPILKKHPEMLQSLKAELIRRKIGDALKNGEQIDEQALAATLTAQMDTFYDMT